MCGKSLVFMFNPVHYYSSFLVITLLNVNSGILAQQMSTEEEQESDFLRFLKIIEPGNHYGDDFTPSTTTTVMTTKQISNESTPDAVATQKAALRDVLMMKLVSYYENKYRISHLDALTPRSHYDTSIINRLAPTRKPQYYRRAPQGHEYPQVRHQAQNHGEGGHRTHAHETTTETVNKMMEVEDDIPDYVSSDLEGGNNVRSADDPSIAEVVVL